MTKKEIIEKHWVKPSELYNVKAWQEAIEKMMDDWGKQQSVLFQEYHRRYRHEEGVSFREECERLGGMFTLADIGISNIYDKFVNGEDIESVSMPGVVYKFPEGGQPIAIINKNE